MIAEEKESLKLQHNDTAHLLICIHDRKNNEALIQSTRNMVVLQYFQGHTYFWETDVQFYVYGSMHRWYILITVQRDATQSSQFIILQVHSTCFGCQPHPSSGVHKTVTIASSTGHTAKYIGILLERYIIHSVTHDSVIIEQYDIY